MEAGEAGSRELHHIVQLGLVSVLERQLVAGGDRAAASDTLERLLELTEAHFAAEELLMRTHGYPAVEEHAVAHRRLLAEVLAIGQEHLGGDDGSARGVARRLRERLGEHLDGMDAAFGHWCDERGVRAD
jgi:hemerythrin